MNQRNGLFVLILLSCCFNSNAQLFGALIGITGGHGVESVLYEIDPITGTVTREIGSTGLFNIGGLAIDPITGDYFAHQNNLPSDSGRLYRIDPDTLNATELGETHISADDLTFSADGNLYGWMTFHDGSLFDNSIIDELVTFNRVNGNASIVGSSELLMFENGMGFDQQGNLFLKGINGTHIGNGVYEYHSQILRFDPDSAAVLQTIPLYDASNNLDIYPRDVLAFDGSNQAFTISRFYNENDPFNPEFEGAFLQRIDLITGAVTTIGGNLGLEITALAFTANVTAVPEPGHFQLVFIILAVGLVLGRRKERGIIHFNCFTYR